MRVRLNFAALLCFPTAMLWVVSHPADGAVDDVLAKARAEASRLERTPASALFDALNSERGKTSLHLSEEQVEFSRRLDEVVRAVLKASLVRGLDAAIPPPSAEVAARLGEAGKQVRQAIVSHAEAMVLESILTPRQASRVRKAYKVMPAAPLVGRYRASRRPAAEVLQSVTELKDVMEHEQRSLSASNGRSSSLFEVVVLFRVPPGRQAEGTFSAAELELLRTLKLSIEQIGLANRLDRLNCDVLHAWLSRNLFADISRLEDWEAADWYDTRARQR